MSDKEITTHAELLAELIKRGFNCVPNDNEIYSHWRSGDIEILDTQHFFKLPYKTMFLILDYQNGQFYLASSNSEVLEILNDISRGDL